jgi:hypothetical protein
MSMAPHKHKRFFHLFPRQMYSARESTQPYFTHENVKLTNALVYIYIYLHHLLVFLLLH